MFFGGGLGRGKLRAVMVFRGNVTGLLSRRTTGTIPAATRCILVNLDFNRFSGTGTYNDGYADNLSLVLGGAAMLPVVSR